MNYPYRFKTKEEFEKEFGPNWKDKILHFHINWALGEMDYLFGTDYPYTLDEINLSYKDPTRDCPREDRLFDDINRISWKIAW
jgi:hypothetical protein